MQKSFSYFLSHAEADALHALQPGATVIANGENIVIEDVNIVSLTGNAVTMFFGEKGVYGFTLIESILPGTHEENDTHELRMHHDRFAARRFPFSLLRGFNREIELKTFDIQKE